MTASSTASDSARPLTTSCTEPSPPTTTTRLAPSRTACSARAASCPGSSDSNASPTSPSAAARWAISGHLRPVEPPPEAGLTRKTVRPALMAVPARGRRVERDPGHPVDSCAELVVGDAHELTLDDDVAHGQEAAGEHATKRTDREE